MEGSFLMSWKTQQSMFLNRLLFLLSKTTIRWTLLKRRYLSIFFGIYICTSSDKQINRFGMTWKMDDFFFSNSAKQPFIADKWSGVVKSKTIPSLTLAPLWISNLVASKKTWRVYSLCIHTWIQWNYLESFFSIMSRITILISSIERCYIKRWIWNNHPLPTKSFKIFLNHFELLNALEFDRICL